MNNYSHSPQQPTIVKYSQSYRNGVESHTFGRHAIGFVIRGTKYFYYGDIRHEANKGEIFFLSSGNHYIENVPDGKKPFEQIIIYYTPEQLSRILGQLELNYGLAISNSHSCPNCREKTHVIYPAWNTAKSFFNTVNDYIKEGVFTNDETAENLKMAELIYLIVTKDDCCIKNKILTHTDQFKESFEQLIFNNIFNNISIKELAQQCNRSMTSFKKIFKQHFYEPPHKWFIRQRLMHSRLLLVSSSKSVSEIGNECNFPNTSHFIKLFKKEYNMTPATYRNRHGDNKKFIAVEIQRKVPAQVRSKTGKTALA